MSTFSFLIIFFLLLIFIVLNYIIVLFIRSFAFPKSALGNVVLAGLAYLQLALSAGYAALHLRLCICRSCGTYCVTTLAAPKRRRREICITVCKRSAAYGMQNQSNR
jgi:hypothetical protein